MTKYYYDTDSHYLSPKWEAAGKVHDWRNHVPSNIRDLWPSFSPDQQRALFENARNQADLEEWD